MSYRKNFFLASFPGCTLRRSAVYLPSFGNELPKFLCHYAFTPQYTHLMVHQSGVSTPIRNSGHIAYTHTPPNPHSKIYTIVWSPVGVDSAEADAFCRVLSMLNPNIFIMSVFDVKSDSRSPVRRVFLSPEAHLTYRG